MFPFKQNIEKFLVFFFTAISIVLVIMGVMRSKSSTTTPATSGQETPPAPATPSVVPQSAVTYSGKAFQTPWGNAVASISVANGKIVGVTMPQVPNSPPSQYAEPYLVSQALSAGNANIQGVSGATYTSIAFKSSLESALAKAQTQGQTITGGTGTSAQAAQAKPTVPRKYRDDEGGEVEFENWFR